LQNSADSICLTRRSVILFPILEDITLLTGKEVISSPISWVSKSIILHTITENVCAVDSNNDLIRFSRNSDENRWTFSNISSQTDVKIIGNLTNWNDLGIFHDKSDHSIAGRDPAGNLIVFRPGSFGWQTENISVYTGKKIMTSPVSWIVTELGNVVAENLAALGNFGELLVFSHMQSDDWKVVDLTAKTGKTIIGGVSGWLMAGGDRLSQRIAGISPEGSLLVFFRFSTQDWSVFNLSSMAGGGKITNSRPIRWIHRLREHIAVCAQNQRLLIFTDNTPNWSLLDVTEVTGLKISEVLTVYEPGDNIIVLVARGTDGSILQFWLNDFPNGPVFTNWQVFNYSQAAGVPVPWISQPTTWLIKETSPNKEQLAAVTAQKHLVMAWDYGGVRYVTDSLSRRTFQAMKNQVGRRNLLAILWDPHRPDHIAPLPSTIDNVLFGSTNSVRDYFLEISGGKFTIERAGLLGWFSASKPWQYYWGPSDPADADGDGWIEPHHSKYAEAIRFADPQINYQLFDWNPFDGNLRPDELAVLIIIPQNSAHGFNRSALSRQHPNAEPLVVDGVTFGTIAEWYAGSPPVPAVAAHELAHLLLGHGDMYFKFTNPDGTELHVNNFYRAGDCSLMDNGHRFTHIDPFAKLKYGWLKPQLITRSGRYSLPSIETKKFIWILINRHSADEYFIVENRWPGTSYDRNMLDHGGLAIWHIMESPAVFGTVSAPPEIPSELWSRVSMGDGTRRAIRLLRPIIAPPLDDSIALRDGADPTTGFDVLSIDPNPRHSTLKWANGTPSGFAIKNISPAGEIMTADIVVPW
jgi:M6 family metalloprotease-like protein